MPTDANTDPAPSQRTVPRWEVSLRLLALAMIVLFVLVEGIPLLTFSVSQWNDRSLITMLWRLTDVLPLLFVPFLLSTLPKERHENQAIKGSLTGWGTRSVKKRRAAATNSSMLPARRSAATADFIRPQMRSAGLSSWAA